MHTDDFRIRVLGGLPALARVTHYLPYTPATWHEPADGPEVEFEILDMRGRPAPWIERKLKDQDWENIETDLLERISDEHRRNYYED